VLYLTCDMSEATIGHVRDFIVRPGNANARDHNVIV